MGRDVARPGHSQFGDGGGRECSTSKERGTKSNNKVRLIKPERIPIPDDRSIQENNGPIAQSRNGGQHHSSVVVALGRFSEQRAQTRMVLEAASSAMA
mmetsp:Transcript_37172/g.55383  ORF Transcript_37172/g.55383 Transcript_37172/m.55383 type:complete len:98 (+) Transcript_37172:823-1116(+)